MVPKLPDQLHALVQAAIVHERECNCPAHLSEPRLTRKEENVIVQVCSDSRLFYMLCGIIAGACGTDIDFRSKQLKYIYESIALHSQN